MSENEEKTVENEELVDNDNENNEVVDNANEIGVENAPHIEKYLEDKEKIEKIHKKVRVKDELTPAEERFIDLYMIYADVGRAMKEAGIETQMPNRKLASLKKKPAFAQALQERRQMMQTESIMSAQEVMEYLTSVVRGEVKDQFGLDAPLSERTKAALEIAKRTVDIEIKEKQKQNENDNQVIITLDWGRDGE